MVRPVLLALVIAGLLSWLFLTPRASSAADFVQDLQDGSVESYQVGTAEDFEVFRGLRLGDRYDGDILVWCNGRLDCHRVQVDELTFLVEGDDTSEDPTSAEDEFLGGGDVAELLVDDYAPNDRPIQRPSGMALEWSGLAWVCAWLTMLFVLITGPQPRRATKWAVFWLFTLPGGLGLLWALIREAPWAREAAQLPEPMPGPAPGRWTGGWAFIATALLSPFLNELPALVQSVLL